MKTIEIAGVEFNFQRIQSLRSTRKTWQISVKKTGKVLECWQRNNRSLSEIVEDIKHTAELTGARFKTDSESA